MIKLMAGLISCIALAGSAVAQVLYVNSPVAWETQRTDSMILRTQLDTAALKGKKVKVTLVRHEKGKRRAGVSKTFPIKDYSQEFFLGLAGNVSYGGKDFLSLEWQITDTVDVKSEVTPIGIVIVEKLPLVDSLISYKVQASGVQQVAAVLRNSAVKLGSHEFNVAWDEKLLYFVCRRITNVNERIVFAVDGENGKSAFVAYSDRFISFIPANDSTDSWHYKRNVQGDGISYSRDPWKTDISKEIAENAVVIRVPWYDLGMVAPFDGRRIGLSVFITDSAGTPWASYPASAQYYLPGTWGNTIFKK